MALNFYSGSRGGGLRGQALFHSMERALVPYPCRGMERALFHTMERALFHTLGMERTALVRNHCQMQDNILYMPNFGLRSCKCGSVVWNEYGTGMERLSENTALEKEKED